MIVVDAFESHSAARARAAGGVGDPGGRRIMATAAPLILCDSHDHAQSDGEGD